MTDTETGAASSRRGFPRVHQVDLSDDPSDDPRRLWSAMAFVAVLALVLGALVGWLIGRSRVDDLENRLEARTNDIQRLEDEEGRRAALIEELEADLRDARDELADREATPDPPPEDEDADAPAQTEAEARENLQLALIGACVDAVAERDPDYDALSERWDAGWGDVLDVDQADFAEQIEECAAPALATPVRERCDRTPDVEDVEANADGIIGQCFNFSVAVTDVVDECTLTGRWDVDFHEALSSYEGERARFTAREPCDVYEGVEVGSRLRVWATVRDTEVDNSLGGGGERVLNFAVEDAEPT